MHKLAHREDYARVLALYTHGYCICGNGSNMRKASLVGVVKKRKNYFDVCEGCLIVLKVSGGNHIHKVPTK
jgi:hypothetical protein